MVDWFSYVKKYVWDENKTPYLIPADKLTRAQAGKEIFVYALFLSILFAFLTLDALAEVRSGSNPFSFLKALYALSLFSCGIFLGITKHTSGAQYCVTAPVAAIVIFIGKGIHLDLSVAENVVLLAIAVAMLRYSLRVVAITRAYPDMRDGEER